MDRELTRLHAIVEGYVQGVSFRYFVKEHADRLGVTGWVRNRWDDTVEVTAEGSRERLEKLLEAVRRGPPAASVRRVLDDWEQATGEFAGFSIRPTV